MLRTLPLLILALVLAGISFGQQPVPGREAPPEQYPFFTDAENRLILDYYRVGSGHVPPGAAKRDGKQTAVVAKPLARGGTVPESTEKVLEPFPKDLDRRLNPVPDGYRRAIAGTTALLIQNTTRLIVDVLDVTSR